MGFFQAGIGNVVSIAVLCLFAAGVLKLFQIHNTLTEIKDELTTLKNHRDFALPDLPAGPPAATATGEEMLRALDREMHLEQSPEAIDPEIVDPR